MDAEEIARVVLAVAVDHPMWIGADGLPLDYLPEREDQIGVFVQEVADQIAPLFKQARQEGAREAWSQGHAAGREYQGDGWNQDAHDPEDDNPYRAERAARAPGSGSAGGGS